MTLLCDPTYHYELVSQYPSQVDYLLIGCHVSEFRAVRFKIGPKPDEQYEEKKATISHDKNQSGWCDGRSMVIYSAVCHSQVSFLWIGLVCRLLHFAFSFSHQTGSISFVPENVCSYCNRQLKSCHDTETRTPWFPWRTQKAFALPALFITVSGWSCTLCQTSPTCMLCLFLGCIICLQSSVASLYCFVWASFISASQEQISSRFRSDLISQREHLYMHPGLWLSPDRAVSCITAKTKHTHSSVNTVMVSLAQSWDACFYCIWTEVCCLNKVSAGDHRVSSCLRTKCCCCPSPTLLSPIYMRHSRTFEELYSKMLYLFRWKKGHLSPMHSV